VKSIPGIDKFSNDIGNTAEMFKTLVEYLRDMTYHSNKYQPTAINQVWKPKQGKSEKLYLGNCKGLGIQIHKHTIRDRTMQALINLVLYPLVELTSDPNNYGARNHRDCKLAIAALRARLSSSHLDIARKALKPRFNNYNPGQNLKPNENKWILAADIQGFFDNINQDWMIKNLFLHPTLKSIVNKWLKAKILEIGTALCRGLHTNTETNNGTAQGCLIAPTLVNFTLNGLEDTILKSIYPITKSIEQRKNIRLSEGRVVRLSRPPLPLGFSLVAPFIRRGEGVPYANTSPPPGSPLRTPFHKKVRCLRSLLRTVVVVFTHVREGGGVARVPYGRGGVGVSMVRFVDDCVVVARSKHMLNHFVTPAITKFLLERGLWLSPHKTKTFSLSQKNTQLDFLGYTFKISKKRSLKRTSSSRENSNNVIALFPNKEIVRDFILKLKKIISDSQNITAMQLIYKLNPMIRNWAIFYNLDNCAHYRAVVRNALYIRTWNWVRKKHPTVGKNKLALMYFVCKKPHQMDVVDFNSPIPQLVVVDDLSQLPEPLEPCELEFPKSEHRFTTEDTNIKLKFTNWTFHGISKSGNYQGISSSESPYAKTKGITKWAYLLNPTDSSPIIKSTKFLLPLNLKLVHAFHPKIDELINFKLGLSLLSSPKIPSLKEKIFKSQKGLCGLCSNPIDFETLHLNTVNIQHMKQTKKGENNFKLSNLTITHSWCQLKQKQKQ
jgi:retron-type reverse transcriptase